MTADLLGRAREREVFDRLLENVRKAQSAVLVVRGEAGIGKTALLRHAARQASGFRCRADRRRRGRDGAAVRRPASAVRADARPARRAPGAAADALSVALGLSLRRRAGPVPRRPGRAQPAVRGRRGAAAALPRRRRAVARRRLGAGPRLRRAPAARGVGGDRVRGPRAGRRAGSSTACPSCRSQGSTTRMRARCWRRAIPGRLDDQVRDRIVAETRGNPLALLELPRGMSAAELAGGFELPAHRRPARPHRGALPAARRRRSRGHAAADAAGGGRPGRRRDAGVAGGRGGSGSTTGALAPAEDAELLEIGARVRFRHPLVRSAVYRRGAARTTAATRTRRWRRSATRSSTRTAARGIARWRRRGPTRTWPPSSSARPGARRRAAGSRRRPRSSSAPTALTADPAHRARPGAGRRAGQAPGRRPRGRARAAGQRGGGSARPAAAGAGRSCCAPRSRSRRTAGATRPRSCSTAARQLEPLDADARARDLPRSADGAASSPVALADGAAARAWRRPPARAPPLARPARAGPAARRPGTAGSGRARRRRAASEERPARLPATAMPDRNAASAGSGSPRRRRSRCGTTTRWGELAAREVELVRDAGALYRAPDRAHGARSSRASSPASSPRPPR